MIVLLLLHALHWSGGTHGFALWVEPPHLVAGVSGSGHGLTVYGGWDVNHQWELTLRR